MSSTLLPKQQLKNYCRRKKYPLPYYVLIGEEKIDLHKYYTVQVSIKDLLVTEGRGLSRRIAEFKAALIALNLIGQSDPSVYDSNIKPKYGKYSLGRSLSVDHISRANRSDSIPSMISYSPGQYSSACPSIDGIDSMTETCDSAYGSETQNGYDTIRKDDDLFFQKLTIVEQDQSSSCTSTLAKLNETNVEEDTELSESFDEGVCIESNGSSSPNSSSPSTSARSSSTEQNTDNTKISNSSSLPDYQTLAQQSNETTTIEKLPETKTKSSSSFLRSFFLLRSLRAIHRRSFRRKSASLLNDKAKPTATNSSDSSTKAEFLFDEPSPSSSSCLNQIQPRPTSSSSTSSAFSSSSSITSSSQSSTSASSTSGSFTLEEPLTAKFVSEENYSPLTNGYSNLITQSIIEEDEEEDEEEDNHAPIVNKSVDQLDHFISKAEKELNNYNSFSRAQSNRSIPRSLSTSYGLSVSNLCSHNHFSIYGPMLCSNTNHGSMKSVTIKETPTAILLRYCVRMYLPIPYYDIHFDDIFYVTCRVLISTSRSEKEKLPVLLPAKYKDREFTAKGNGQTLPKARNMAAEIIIEKLKNAEIYVE